jgi:hypothetical protein
MEHKIVIDVPGCQPTLNFRSEFDFEHLQNSSVPTINIRGDFVVRRNGYPIAGSAPNI